MPLIISRLREFYAKHERLPTHGEMVKLLHYSSRGSTYYVVKRLLKEGIVQKDEYGRLIPKSLLDIPFLGVIKAGYPSGGFVQPDTVINLRRYFSHIHDGSFALKISGDSMVEAGITDGDIVIVDPKRPVVKGDIVAACVDGEWTVKYFKKQNGNISLVPANSNYPVIYPLQSLTIGGVIVSVMRNYY